MIFKGRFHGGPAFLGLSATGTGDFAVREGIKKSTKSAEAFAELIFLLTFAPR